jgi:S1-C subfamily serine protease
MKFLSFLFIALFWLPVAYASSPTEAIGNNRTVEISSNMSSLEAKVRNAAVRVITAGGGHGSGSLIQYSDMQLILTAQHVASEPVGTSYRIIKGNVISEAFLIYSNNDLDIAVLWVRMPFESGAIDWNPSSSIAAVGTAITYSGYPSFHSLMSFRGRVAGFETRSNGNVNIILHTFGYFGCSGSSIYNDDGEIIGILWGIDNGRDGSTIENIVWVSPIQNLNIRMALQSVCTVVPEGTFRACR